MTRLQGRHALVTGGTGGIGRAIAEALARADALVVVTGRDAGRGAEVAGRIREQGGRAEFVKADLASGEGVRLLTKDTQTTAGGRIDILVNNAAHILPGQSLLEATEEQIDAALGRNVRAPFLLPPRWCPAW